MALQFLGTFLILFVVFLCLGLMTHQEEMDYEDSIPLHKFHCWAIVVCLWGVILSAICAVWGL